MEKPIKILVLNNEFEADLIRQILTEKDIPFMMRTFHDSAYDGLWEARSGWGHLMAPSEFKDEILKIYSEMANSKVDGAEDFGQ
jgi:predicted membrane chloride channel (bestrophin family)